MWTPVSVLSVRLTVCAETNSRRHDRNKRAMSARSVQGRKRRRSKEGEEVRKIQTGPKGTGELYK